VQTVCYTCWEEGAFAALGLTGRCAAGDCKGLVTRPVSTKTPVVSHYWRDQAQADHWRTTSGADPGLVGHCCGSHAAVHTHTAPEVEDTLKTAGSTDSAILAPYLDSFVIV
jgi:hypothetical protein